MVYNKLDDHEQDGNTLTLRFVASTNDSTLMATTRVGQHDARKWADRIEGGIDAEAMRDSEGYVEKYNSLPVDFDPRPTIETVMDSDISWIIESLNGPLLTLKTPEEDVLRTARLCRAHAEGDEIDRLRHRGT